MRKEDMNLTHLFKNVIVMSGTPDWVQRVVTNKNKQNECKCSPKLAMDNGWICTPSLSLVNCSRASWPAAVKAVFCRELEVFRENGGIFKPTILVNCKSIDDIANLREVPWFKDNAGKLFHLISIHSEKSVHDKVGSVKDLCAEIDGREVRAEEAYDAITSIDKQEDSLPVIVFQVQMIGEGINVRSFNSVITASNCDKTAMQQIGRVIREFHVTKTVVEKHEEKADGFFGKLFGKTKTVEVPVEKTFSKVKDGTANVYVINENNEEIKKLIYNLMYCYDLTRDCFRWGDRIDINEGSAPEILDEEDSAKLQTASWNPIDGNDPAIIDMMSEIRRRLQTTCFDMFFDEQEDNDNDGIPDLDEFKALLAKKKEEGFIEVWAGKATRDDPREMMTRFGNWTTKLLTGRVYRELWDKSVKDFFLYVTRDEETAEFLCQHLSKKTLAALRGSY